MEPAEVAREMAFECFLALLGNPFETEKDPDVLVKKAFVMRDAFLREEALREEAKRKHNGGRNSG